MVPLSQAAVSVFDGGFMQGVTVAEQLRTFRGQVVSARYAPGAAGQVAGDCRRRSGNAAGGVGADCRSSWWSRIGSCSIRRMIRALTIFVTPGMYAGVCGGRPAAGADGVRAYAAVGVWAWAEKYRHGRVAGGHRRAAGPGDVLAGGAEVPQPDALLPGGSKAREIEAGARALVLDERGFVTEASTANVWSYFADEGLVSPPKENILPGVTVAVVEELAGQTRDSVFAPRADGG